jgi:hypothetical protein
MCRQYGNLCEKKLSNNEKYTQEIEGIQVHSPSCNDTNNDITHILPFKVLRHRIRDECVLEAMCYVAHVVLLLRYTFIRFLADLFNVMNHIKASLDLIFWMVPVKMTGTKVLVSVISDLVPVKILCPPCDNTVVNESLSQRGGFVTFNLFPAVTSLRLSY